MITGSTIIFCLFTYIAIVSHLLILFYRLTGSPEIEQMKMKFSEHQKKIYNQINQERKLHYIYGLLIGIACSIFYLKIYPNVSNPVCVYVGLSTIIAQNFYLLMPKSKWMIDYIEHPEQIYIWNKIYQKFRYLSAYGSFLGFTIFIASRVF